VTPEQAVNPEPAAVAGPEQTPPPPSRPEPVPTPLWEKIKASPRYAPELLASAAVDTLGGQVEEYARWLAGTYPHATPDAIARYAAQRYAKGAGYASLAAALSPPWGTLAQGAALIWAHARLVLLIAAAYGHSPTAPERVPELLVLLGVHDDVPTAQAALRAAGTHPAAGPVSGWSGLARTLAGPLSGLGLRSRLLPGAGLLLGAVYSGSATERLARRAIGHYGPRQRREAGAAR
jgi:hypothetical protein